MKTKKIVLMLILFVLLISSVSAQLADYPPELENGGAQPAFASPGTTVVYHVTYTDADGDTPEYVRLHFPHVSYEMKKVSGNHKTGAIYEYSWKPDQSLEYWFEASDGKATARDPDYERGTLAPTDILPEIPENNKIYLFSRETSKPLWSYDTGPDWVHKVALSNDGKYIAVKTSDYIYLFSKETKNLLWKYQCIDDIGKNKEAVAGWVDISSDGRYIAAGCQSSLILFSIESNRILWSYESNSNIYSASISSDGEYIVVGTMGTNEIILFSKKSNKPIWKYEGGGDIHGLAISADGRYIAAGAHCPDRRAYLFSRQSNKPLISYVASEDSPVWTAAMSSDGKYAVYGLDGGDGFNNIFIFSPDMEEPLQKYSVGGPVRSIAISDAGKYIAAASGVDYSVYLFDRDSDQRIWQYRAGERVGSVSVSSDAEYIAAGSKDKRVYIFSKNSSQPLWHHNAAEWVNSVAISGDSQYIVAGTGASQYLSEAHAISPEAALAGKTSVCGDTICEGGETFETCPQDCCSPGGCVEDLGEEKEEIKEERFEEERFREKIKRESICGNNLCESPQESYETCPQDCCGEDCDDDSGDEDLEERKIEDEPNKKGFFQAIIDFLNGLFGK